METVQPNHDHTCVLLIEDEDGLRQGLTDLLELEGYTVSAACNGKEALALLEKIPKPCVILLDLFMPEMNGAEFLMELNKNRHHVIVSLPVVVVTAAPESSDIVKTVRPLAAELIKKPVDIDMVLQIVQRHCQQAADRNAP